MGNFQESFNVSHSDVTQLSSNQFSDFIPYIEFARAAYCTPNKIVGWQCGGWFFFLNTLYCRILIGTTKRRLQCPPWLCANVDRW